tara:strand:+ start:1402 stop:1644 length:243 start_codon:yes stop_codon:yes gene_type:complete
MKTVSQFLQLTTKAIMSNGTTHNQWFIHFSGHVNKIDIDYYSCGWDMSLKQKYEPKRCTIYLDDEDSIQEGYWFIKNRLG